MPERLRTARGFGLGLGDRSRSEILIPAKIRKNMTASADAVFTVLLFTIALAELQNLYTVSRFSFQSSLQEQVRRPMEP